MSTMSSYRRWTRDQEDIDRLPHGMVRTAYDADTRQYSFLDTTDGTHYVGAPGEAYGTLVPAATANFPKASRTSGRRPTLQAYDRPVFFADDIGSQQRRSPQPSTGHKRNPTMPASSRHHSSSSSSSSSSTRKQGLKRSASFSDFVPPHLIARASNSSDVPTATTPSKPRSARARGRTMKSAPPSPPPPPYEDEKKKPAELWSSPTDSLSSLPTLSGSPPPLPPKDYPAFSAQQSETCAPHVAKRLTARVRAAKGGQHSPKGRSGDDGWVLV